MSNSQSTQNHCSTRHKYSIKWYAQLFCEVILGLFFVEICTGCSSPQSAEFAGNKPKIIATTPAWAAVANAITQGVFSVHSIITPSTDPHDFEPSAEDIRHLNQANLIIANGGGYDDILLRGVDHPSHIINAFRLAHKPSQANMHVFLDLPTVILVAQKLTDALDQQDHADASKYDHNMQVFKHDIEARILHLEIMQQRHRPTSVIQTESVGTYILHIAHIMDKSPLSLQEDKEPSAADINHIIQLLTHKEVNALIVNQGAQDSRTDHLTKIAEMRGVPVIDFSESPNAGQSYLDWLDSMIRPLILAVRN